MKVVMKPTIDLEEVCQELNLHMSDFEFVQMVENDSYVTLDVSDEACEELMEEIEWEEGKMISRQKRLENQLMLVLMLRNKGYTDSVLVSVSW